MRIIINCSNLRIGGGVQVAHSFLNEISNRQDHKYTVILSSVLYKQINIQNFSKQFEFRIYNQKPSLIGAFWGFDRVLRQIESVLIPDVVFSVFGPTYWKPKTTHIAGYAIPHFIHFDSPFFSQLAVYEKIKLLIEKIIKFRMLRKQVDVLVSETEAVTKGLQQVFEDKKIHTVSNYYNSIFDYPSLWVDSQIKKKENTINILTVTANYPHKNLRIIPQIIDHLKDNYKSVDFCFILTLSEEELNALGFKEDHKQHVKALGKQSIHQCPPLYQVSDVMFLPTLLECFSASYPEAMVMNVPIVTTNLDFARTVCGDAALYYDPLSASDAGDMIIEAVKNTELRENLIQNGKEQLLKFDSHKARAQKYLDIIESYGPK